MDGRHYEVREEFRTSRSRHRAPSPPAEAVDRGYDQGGGYEAEFYPGSAPIHIIETEGGGSAPLASGALQLPPSRSRPRSLPALSNAVIQTRPRRRRQRSPSDSRSPSPDWYERERERDRERERERLRAEAAAAKTPVEKAGEVLKDKFSHSTAGLGVGLLGAAVGAWVASEASDARDRYRTGKELEEHHNNPKYRPTSPRDASSKSKIALTVLGAVVGGLGANAIERRVEGARERDKDRRENWDRRWRGRERERGRHDGGGGDDGDGYYTSGDEGRRRSVTREVEVHSRGRRVRRGDESEFEEEDYVYEERRPRRKRSESGYRYKD